MKKHLYINDFDICEYGIYISSDTYLDAPLIDYKEYQIPARDGNVIQYNKRLNNVVRKFDCYINDNTDVKTALFNLKKLLYKNFGYLKLVSDYDSDTYQYGYLAQAIDVTPFNLGMTATFSLYFSCLPQKYFIDDIERSIGGFSGTSVNDTYSNDDPAVILINNNSKIAWPQTQIGWAISYGGQATSGTGTVKASSTSDKKFVVLERTGTGFYWVGETESGTFQLDNYESHGGVINTAAPIFDTHRISIRQSFNDVPSTSLDFLWREKTSEYLINELAFGFAPQIIIELYSGGSSLTNNGDYYFAFNDKIVKFNAIKLFNDYGIAFAKENFSYKYGTDLYFDLYLDLQNSIAYLLNGRTTESEVLLDVSNYIDYLDDLKFDDTQLSIKYFTTGDSPLANRPRDIVIKMGWWTL